MIRLVCVVLSCTLCGIASPAVAQQPATTRGLVVRYDFANADGDVVHDRSGVGSPLNLRIKDTGQVKRSAGSLTVTGNTTIASQTPAKKLTDAIKRSGQFTVEVWVQTNSDSQSGPARIVTLSENSVKRNFTLGQDKDRYAVRFRTGKTDANGLPGLVSPAKAVVTKLTHLVYTRSKNGDTLMYVNGKRVAKGKSAGDLKDWDGSNRLALANEMTGDRPFQGTYYAMAIYDAALTEKEVQGNFAAGKQTAPTTTVAKQNLLSETASSDKQRVTSGLQVFYNFGEPSGEWVRDRSSRGEAIDLKIGDPKAVLRRDGGLEIKGATSLRSTKPATRLARAIKASGAFTIEAWIAPQNTNLKGPARIVTLSKDGNQRNFTLGQDGDRFDVRFLTNRTDRNGIPSTTTDGGTLKTKLVHVVYTRSQSGDAKIYMDGSVAKSGEVAGDLGNWDPSFRLALGDEFSGDRQWLGAYHLVAIYNRDLSGREVKQNFQAGANGHSGHATDSTNEAIAKQASPQALFFENKVAPLLAKHCLECHESAVSEGGLNLARKSAAFAGGDSGKVIVAKNASVSLLWQSVEHDEMPHNRTPLLDKEKQVLRTWIDSGAQWTFDFIDPAVYAHEGRTNQIWLRRLTVPEYIETVRATFAVDIDDEANQLLPRDMRADGFSNTAYNLNVDLQHVDAYAKLADIVVGRLDVRPFAQMFRRKLSMTDDDMRGLISEMGKWVLRGPLEEHEIVLYRGISTSVASAGGSVDDAIGYVIRAMVQSPRFLYRIEKQRGDGGYRELNEYELASRISYIVWGASPDKALYAAAESGELYDDQGLSEQVDRMLKEPRAVSRSLSFVSEWLNLGRMDNMQPSRDRFPKWEASLAQDMRDETLLFAREVLWNQKRPLADLLSAQVTFLTPKLAKHYGIKPQGDGPRRYDLTSIPSRGGLMTHGSVLTVGGDDASMVTRGLLVMHELLRGIVKDPPPGTDTTPVPSEPGLSQRGIAEDRIANDACSGCHRKFEPLAFGLEKFDGVGAFHDVDQYGNKLREDGQVLIPGDSEPKRYETAAELMEILAKSERVKETLTWKITQFSLGRPLLVEDAPIVREIHREAQKNGGTYPALISAIVTSDLVRKTKTESN
ncbi:MAG: LamG-like jellyroll fold domain-containing protein [Pirellulaceae bacterium]